MDTAVLTGKERRSGLLRQVLTSLLAGLALFVVVLAVLCGGYQLWYAGRIYPGVSAAGVDLGGLNPQQAAQRLSQEWTYPNQGRVALTYNDRVWVLSPAQLGLGLDAQATAQQAFDAGRGGDLFSRLSEQLLARQSGVTIQPVLVFDQHSAYEQLSHIAAQIDEPAQAASVALNGTQVTTQPSKTGRALDMAATAQAVSKQLSTLRDGAVPLIVRELQPQVSDVSGLAQQAQNLLSAPLTLTISPDQSAQVGPWEIKPEALASLISFQQDGNAASPRLALNVDPLRNYLINLSTQVAVDPQNARFHFDPNSGQLTLVSHAVEGRKLDVEATLNQIVQKLGAGEHNVPLVFQTVPAAAGDDATAQALGIKDLVSQQVSYFRGSPADRVKNIQIAAARFDGLLVPPGATVSMANVLGDVSLDNGYAEAAIIYGDRTIQGVGGGVCQVSTTLFRTVFFGGYPIVERHPHAYRVLYYEQTAKGIDPSLAGLDATVFVPLVDFKFKNDSSSWLLMETTVNPSNYSLTWSFYSTSDGRKVDWQTTGLKNVTPPPPDRYIENPALASGKIHQVDYAVSGAEVTVTRTVTRDGQTVLQDTVYTHFQPWPNIYEYGPGTQIPGQ